MIETLSADGDATFPTRTEGKRFAVSAYGTWGGGTITLFAVTDDGSEEIPIKDINGTAISWTSNDGAEVLLPTKTLLARLAGATTPSLSIQAEPCFP